MYSKKIHSSKKPRLSINLNKILVTKDNNDQFGILECAVISIRFLKFLPGGQLLSSSKTRFLTKVEKLEYDMIM